MSSSALSRINDLPVRAAEAELMSCCASPQWASAMAAGRPYPHAEAATDAARASLAALPWSEVERALAAHPRIGARPVGDGRDAAWSRREQAGVDRDDDLTVDALAEVNRAYEERFGRVLLIYATGKSGAEMVEAARSRLDNDDSTEQRVVREELTKIVGLRVRRLFDANEEVDR